MIRPAHTQQATTRPIADHHEELSERRLVGGPARADRHARQRHPGGHDQHEPAGEAGAGLLGPGVLAALGVLHPIVGQRLEAAVEVGAADLVGDEQRLADGVGGGVGEPLP